jgi:AcrR family transcriptional regulator
VPDAVQQRAIAETARALFIRQGYGQTTTDEVAARCQISKRTLYRLFPSKQDLFAAAVDAHRQAMLDLPGDDDDLPLTEALERIFRVDIDPEADRERGAFLRLVMIESEQFPELNDILRERGIDRSRSLLASWFARQRELGRIELDDVESGARMLMDMMFGAVAFKLGKDLALRQGEERKAHLQRCIGVFVNGIRPRSR